MQKATKLFRLQKLFREIRLERSSIKNYDEHFDSFRQFHDEYGRPGSESDQTGPEPDIKGDAFSSAKELVAAMDTITWEEINNILISQTDEDEVPKVNKSQSQSNTDNQNKAPNRKALIKDLEDETANESKPVVSSKTRQRKKAKANARRKANAKRGVAEEEATAESTPGSLLRCATVGSKKGSGWKGWELVAIDNLLTEVKTEVISPESAVSGTVRKSKRRKA
ncbi:uncharacterized protein MELLADRAFT_68423 [Melampsora larici-populina 98AG31]|uniref:Uncharacterized protein n=1 Tax=Melampsora larici-populina (strain 98AG31 / pathotype 3-4-7) TaxID=747676 RepID=F4S6S2_MELLP|nr:uncharacterized protein MELLADRAFT_68423 [Melampsora larici-populina 98AG31]EGF99619.1 hypothetical protein MELLADRAFT_68423 [Melampsora larici-populina 98AG31]